MRDYRKETEWEKEKYKRVFAKIDKDFADKFLSALDEPYAIWLKRKMNEYLDKKGMICMKYNLKDYIEAVKQFIEDSKEWQYLDNYKFYTSDKNGWTETSDNAHGGLDVSWSFHKEPDFDEIRRKFIELINNDLIGMADNDVKNIGITIENLD